MSLAMILYPPPTRRGLEEWAFHNFDHHKAINAGISRTRNIEPALFDIYPMPTNSLERWLQAHQEQHDLQTSILGVPGVDLSTVDFSDQRQMDAFLWTHFLQHRACAEALGMGT